ncbi:putative membrane protein [Helicobacter pylori Hp H-6]|uniref:Putative membrane protein n=1 Tax=Helicobacter pylori Hp H-6 TaxID=992061 RepID=I9UNY6_HELPX|nr:putative membrane protein [Helicobacter pylori Hp H-6]
MFLKSVGILNFLFYCAMGVFGSVILDFLKWAFLLYFIILKLILKNISNSFYKGIGGILK